MKPRFSLDAPRIADMIGRVLVLTFGGVALLQWVAATFLEGPGGHGASGYAHLLRDGALALLPVAVVVLMSARLSRRFGRVRGRLAVALLYAAVMGEGSIWHQLFPDSGHAHLDEISPLSVGGHTLLIMAIAAAYALLIDRLLAFAALLFDGEHGRFRLPARLALPGRLGVALLIASPLFLLSGGGHAIAQTSFPDQTIHPSGSLVLIARQLSDGTMAYVAPDYGANGMRPVIEMTEGETLNITLKNELRTEVSLHVHGVHYNPDSDGTRHSNSVVAPGGQRVYQWRAAQGTAGYWHYHDHVIGDDEGTGGILGGLYGGLIVRRPGEPRPVKTFVVVGHDKTLNGRIYPDTPTFEARKGELIEFLVISHGNRVHTFHLHGHRWLTPARPADPNPQAGANAVSGREDNHILAPGDSFGFLAIAGEGVGPGMWMYHCHFQDHAGAMKGFFKVHPAIESLSERSRTFAETGKTVSGRFLEYWETHGGLAQQGFPLSEPFMEKSDLDGKTYLVQYFERAVFEMHPENKPPHDVLLSQLGTFRYKEKYPGGR